MKTKSLRSRLLGSSFALVGLLGGITSFIAPAMAAVNVSGQRFEVTFTPSGAGCFIFDASDNLTFLPLNNQKIELKYKTYPTLAPAPGSPFVNSVPEGWLARSSSVAINGIQEDDPAAGGQQDSISGHYFDQKGKLYSFRGQVPVNTPTLLCP